MDECRLLASQLRRIDNELSQYQFPVQTFPILDSALDKHQWEHQTKIIGLRKLHDAVKVDLEAIQKFLSDPDAANLPPISTNAPYNIGVYLEFLMAPPPVSSIFKSFTIGSDQNIRKKNRRNVEATKVDVVSDHGKLWTRLNTVKNSRLLAEFREMDSYLTDSTDDEQQRPSLAPKEFDNSLLRMGRSLIQASKANPIFVLDSTGTVFESTPCITLRLSRLNPDAPEHENDPRIKKTIHSLIDMGIDVQIGERRRVSLTASEPSPSRPLQFKPSRFINLDLSALIALVSDITHSQLPLSRDEIDQRFAPQQQERPWKKKAQEDEPGNDLESDPQLKSQLLQEMNKSWMQAIRDQISDIPHANIQFWTTPEAKERCLRIVEKLGGPQEKHRSNALFASDASVRDSYWKDSRFPPQTIPLLPIRVFGLNPSLTSLETQNGIQPLDCSPFFQRLHFTCQDILRQGSVELTNKAASYDGRIEIQRATALKSSPRLTTHTVESMLWGSRLGWTTLSANRASVKALLREMTGRSHSITVADQPQGEATTAAIWLLDPRSLAERMRSS